MVLSEALPWSFIERASPLVWLWALLLGWAPVTNIAYYHITNTVQDLGPIVLGSIVLGPTSGARMLTYHITNSTSLSFVALTTNAHVIQRLLFPNQPDNNLITTYQLPSSLELDSVLY